MNYRLLLVEDEPGLIRAISELLLGQGYAQDAGFNSDFAAQIGLDDRKVPVESFLRRIGPPTVMAPGCVVRFGAVQVDFQNSEVLRDGGRVGLSEREARLLRYLVENRGRIISRDTLLEQVWGYQRAPLTRTVDVTILRLRQKVEADPRHPRFIVTVHGMGYRFDG